MAGTGVGKFSSTAGNNTGNMTVNFAENMAPSNVNNAARELMGHIYDMYKQIGDGYFEFGDGDATYTVARSDADTITITSSSDISSVYFPGRKIRITDGGANVVEGTIASSSHSSTTQTVNLTGISLASGTPTKVELGIDTAAFGGRIILDDDGDTYIEAPTDDTIDIYVAGAKDFVITANTFTAESGSTIAAQALTATTGAFTDNVTITTADNTDTLSLISTDADAAVGPNLRFYRNSASPANNDLASTIDFEGRNNNSQDVVYGSIHSIIGDVTDGSEVGTMEINTMYNGTERSRISLAQTGTVFNDDSQDMDFRVESNDNPNMLKVDGGNNRLGIGVSSGNPSYSFHHAATNNDLIALHHNEATSGNVFGMQIDFSSTVNDATSFFIRCMGNDRGTSRFKVESNGNVESATNSYGSTSDERIKQNITDANSQWDDIKNLKVRNFKFKDDVRTEDAGGQAANTYIGLVAQEVESVSPGLVKLGLPSPSDIISNSAFGTLYEDGDTIPDGKRIGEVKEVKEQVKSVSYSVLYMKAIKALQEAMIKIEDLESRVTTLEG